MATVAAGYSVRLAARPGALPGCVLDALGKLDAETFPKDARESLWNRYWWLAETANGKAIGFAGLKVLPKEPNVGYFCRAGVLPAHRKRGLHRRLIAARLRYAKRIGLESIITYTVHDNAASINALTALGFRAYTPHDKWAGASVCYWYKRLQNG